MSSLNSISPEKLSRLVGVPHGPALVDVRPEEDLAADPRFIPGAVRRVHSTVADWGSEFAGRSAVVICENGQGLSEGVAAWLRHAGASSAEVLLGGHAAWAIAGLPLVPEGKLPPRDSQGRTVWVTRSRPKIDRIACPWLIRRFVDPAAVFLFVSPAEVHAVAERFNAAPFERIRQIVSEVLQKRSVDSGADHAKLQLDRLAPLMQIAAEAVAAGDIRAITPYLKVLDRLDRYQTVASANQVYDDEARKKLMDRINRMAENFGVDEVMAAARAHRIKIGAIPPDEPGETDAVDDPASPAEAQPEGQSEAANWMSI